MKKNIQLLALTGWDDFIPVLWPSAKTFYEKYGKYPAKYNWVVPTCEIHKDFEENKKQLLLNPPDILGLSLYVWNYEQSLALMAWAKEQWPNCLVITGGPHQYFKHHKDWFKKYWFIDASLPSDVYGEVAITDILDNLNDDNTINWNTVEQMVYPSKDKSMILRSPKATYKRDFKWDFSAFKEQLPFIHDYVKYYYSVNPTGILHSKIETTRGCPYECTFCDWGGGVGTKVILKNLDCVKQDLDVLLSLETSSIYVCDANFGINGERDVEIIEYIAGKKKSLRNDSFPNVQYGGYAKTNKHFDYLKKIFTIEAKNKLSYVYKISQQSFNDQILANVKRTDLRSNEHFELANYLRTTFGYEATIEIILGLPGTTIDTWYNEFNKPYEESILVRAYEWYLLPEAESFSEEYRKKWQIGTAKKGIYSDYKIPGEIVVAGSTFTRDDYKVFLTVCSLYNFFVQSGVYKKSIKAFLKVNNLKYGDFLKKFYNECYPLLKQNSLESFTHFENHLDLFVSEDINEKFLGINWGTNDGPTSHIFIYFIFEYFMNYEMLGPIVEQWFVDSGVNKSLVVLDADIIYSKNRLNTIKRSSLFTAVKFNNYTTVEEFLEDAMRSNQYAYGNLLTGDNVLSIKYLFTL